MSQQCNTECCDAAETSQAGQECCESQCPIERATAMWEGAFCQAMRDVMAAQLRTRIEKQWGEIIAKEADAFVASMAAQWGVSIAKVQAHTARESFKQTMAANWVAAAGAKK